MENSAASVPEHRPDSSRTPPITNSRVNMDVSIHTHGAKTNAMRVAGGPFLSDRDLDGEARTGKNRNRDLNAFIPKNRPNFNADSIPEAAESGNVTHDKDRTHTANHASRQI